MKRRDFLKGLLCLPALPSAVALATVDGVEAEESKIAEPATVDRCRVCGRLRAFMHTRSPDAWNVSDAYNSISSYAYDSMMLGCLALCDIGQDVIDTEEIWVSKAEYERCTGSHIVLPGM